MEWSKEKTLKLIGLLQAKTKLWNSAYLGKKLLPREKQIRKQELRYIANVFNISVSDVTKKIQHLRTQYNREFARETQALSNQDSYTKYESNWYAYDYLHFLKDSNKSYRVITQDSSSIKNGNSPIITETTDNEIDCLPPPAKRTKNMSHEDTTTIQKRNELSLFGEYIANELCSLKCEKSLLLAKKRIQDVIFDLKMNMISEAKKASVCAIYPAEVASNDKIWYTTPISNTDAMATDIII